MNIFSPTSFFDLDSYEHPTLFEQVTYVWEALPKIAPYLLSEKSSLSLGRVQGEVDPRAILVNPELIFIGKGTVVEAGAYIQGPCYIGEECQIRHGAYLRGNVLIGHQSIVGHATEIKNSILLNRAHAAHFAYLGDSILGNEVNLGAGVKCANLRLDGKRVHISYRSLHIETHIETGLRKCGAILGDGVSLGCNVVTNPGTLMGKKSSSFPCLNLGGFITENSIIKTHSHENKALSPL